MAAIYPQGTHDLYDFLGVSQGAHGNETAKIEDPGHQIPSEVSDLKAEKPLNLIDHDHKTNTYTVNVSKIGLGKIIKGAFPYVIIFAIGLLIYFTVFTNVSIKSLFAGKPQPVQQQAQTQAAAQAPQIAATAAYSNWINGYFYDVSDPKLLDPNADLSGNGLTNYQKFLLGLNPRVKDSLGLGKTDTEELLAGINPLTGDALTQDQKDFINKNIDLEAVSNKLSLQTASAAPQVAGASTGNTPNLAFANRNQVQLDDNINGEIDIPTLNLKVPLIWTKDTNNFEKDLPNGLVHYPGTPMPGEMGTSYISGHSSNYVWIKGKYNYVFQHLDKLKQYDAFTLTATNTAGKKVTFHYVVTASGIFKADDQKQFANIGKSTIALSTCWPVGTSANRLVVFAQLTQTETGN